MKHIRNRYFFATDLLLLSLAAYLSFVLRLEHLDLQRYWTPAALFTALILVITPLIFYRMGMYARYWRYASIEELLALTLAILAAAGLAGGIGLVSSRMLVSIADLPRSIPFIFFLLALVVTAGPRLTTRLLPRYSRHRSDSHTVPAALIMGAGDAGSLIAREIQRHPRPGMTVVGFLDDDPQKHHMLIHGLPVLGTRYDLPDLVARYQVQQLLIAMPSAPGKVIREITQMGEQAGVQVKTMPSVAELLDGTVSISQIRDVQIEDLLRREPIQTDVAAVRELIYGRRVLITGGGGSIGSELCRQVLRCQPTALIILGHGENSVFEIHNELLRQQAANQPASCLWPTRMPNGNPVATQIEAVIADIRCAERIHAIFAHYRPDIVFHAAAHKHVPLMEANPVEAITNNVLGTRNLLNAALATEVSYFVMISTDKAVNPTSIMGASKRTAELLVHQAARRSGRPYVAVRFGNVLGSRGSVVLTFKRQIAAGGPVTITHPEMRRFFMTIPEAVQLVLQAAVLGHGGEVFMLDMGEPVKIVDLARTMIELSGLEVGRDIDLTFTGMRPGEKLYEELFVPGEEYQPTPHQKIFIARNASNTVSPFLNHAVEVLAHAAEQHDTAAILRVLHQLIPEFQAPPADTPASTPAHSDPTTPRIGEQPLYVPAH